MTPGRAPREADESAESGETAEISASFDIDFIL
jgi:hypothetical protein